MACVLPVGGPMIRTSRKIAAQPPQESQPAAPAAKATGKSESVTGFRAAQATTEANPGLSLESTSKALGAKQGSKSGLLAFRAELAKSGRDPELLDASKETKQLQVATTKLQGVMQQVVQEVMQQLLQFDGKNVATQQSLAAFAGNVGEMRQAVLELEERVHEKSAALLAAGVGFDGKPVPTPAEQEAIAEAMHEQAKLMDMATSMHKIADKFAEGILRQTGDAPKAVELAQDTLMKTVRNIR